jgi:hypothetical protein
VATIHNMVKESGRVLPRPSTIFHAYVSVDTPWVTQTLSHYTPVKRGKVSSNLMTHEATQFARSQKIMYAPVHNQKLVHQGSTDMGLNRHRRGLTP